MTPTDTDPTRPEAFSEGGRGVKLTVYVRPETVATIDYCAREMRVTREAAASVLLLRGVFAARDDFAAVGTPAAKRIVRRFERFLAALIAAGNGGTGGPVNVG